MERAISQWSRFQRGMGTHARLSSVLFWFRGNNYARFLRVPLDAPGLLTTRIDPEQFVPIDLAHVCDNVSPPRGMR